MKEMLRKFDEFLEAQKKSELQVFFLLPIIMFGFIAYYFVYPYTDGALKQAQNNEQQVIKNISDTKNKISRLNMTNIRIANSIRKVGKEIASLKETRMQLENMVGHLSFLRFDLNKWAKFYNEIPKLAKKHNLVILSLKNVVNNPTNNKTKNNYVHEKMQISIKVMGDYRNVIKFMNEFENRRELLKVKSFSSDGDISTIKLEVFGAEI